MTSTRPAESPAEAAVFPVALEEGGSGATLVHALSVPGCVAFGSDRSAALDRFPRALSLWLRFLAEIGQAVPPADAELQVMVEEWQETDAEVTADGSRSLFEADTHSLTDSDVADMLRRLGELRGRLLATVRELEPAAIQADRGGWTVDSSLRDLARGQWWLLTRLGASPMAEVPRQTLGQLDTAMALTVQQFSHLPAHLEHAVLQLDGERWTPRKVARRMLWREWSVGQNVMRTGTEQPSSV